MKINKKNIMDIINKYDWLCAILLLIIMLFLLKEKILIFYDNNYSIIDNIISVFGTLFGFILTCLSIFIVFKTDEKYANTKASAKGATNKLLNNPKFNDLYLLFLKNLYSIGMILLLSFAIYFILETSLILIIMFIIIYIFLILLSIIRTLLSLIAFQTLIKILIESK